ncbi:MAG: hypothetical protein V5A59_10905 [Bacteroidales bacterium]
MAHLVFPITSSTRRHQKITGNHSELTVSPGHAHNDYENENPLHDALQYDALQQNHSMD